MKSAKSISQSELIIKCVQCLNMFKPQPKFIKEVIESLIDREYVKRDEADTTKLLYMA